MSITFPKIAKFAKTRGEKAPRPVRGRAAYPAYLCKYAEQAPSGAAICKIYRAFYAFPLAFSALRNIKLLRQAIFFSARGGAAI